MQSYALYCWRQQVLVMILFKLRPLLFPQADTLLPSEGQQRLCGRALPSSSRPSLFSGD